MSLLIAVLALLFAGRLILKNYNPQGVLFTTGIAMMVIAILLNHAFLVNPSTGWIGFDVFEYISILIISVGIIHALVQRYFDGQMTTPDHQAPIAEHTTDEPDAPLYYILLPMLPLFLMLTFSKMGVGTVRVGLSTAILISLFISLICEYLRHRDATTVFAGLQSVFNDMGKVFASVVTLIIPGETFAMGLKSIGAIDDGYGPTGSSGDADQA